jgi:hypothetical protein
VVSTSETEVPTAVGTTTFATLRPLVAARFGAPSSLVYPMTYSSGSTAEPLIDEGVSGHDSDTTYVQAVTAQMGSSTQVWISDTFTFPAFAATFVDINSVTLRGVLRTVAATLPGGAPFLALSNFYLGYTDGTAFGTAFLGNPNTTSNNYVTYSRSLTTDELNNGLPFAQADLASYEWFLIRVGFNYGANYGIYQARFTAFDLTANGTVAGGSRTRSKITVGPTEWLRTEEDLASYTDIDTAAAADFSNSDLNIPWDYAEFNSKVYFTNGVDDLAWYPDTGNIMAQLTSQPVGRCLGSYGSRLFQGDVNESGTRTQYRLIWSAINDGTDWTSASAGSLDLDETPGAIVRLVPFTEARDQTFIGILAVFKTDSIFHIEATGVSSDPFDKRVMSSVIGTPAPRTVQAYTRGDGQQVLAFLGTDHGRLGIFEWNGDEAVPIGENITETINDTITWGRIGNSWAAVDPRSSLYILAVPEGSDFPNVAYVYDITRKIWSKWDFNGRIVSAAPWNFTGRWTLVLGRYEGIKPYFYYPQGDVDTTTQQAQAGEIRAAMRTGVFQLARDENGSPKRSTLYRVWVWYRNYTSETTITVRASTDGFVTSSSSVNTTKAATTGDLTLFKADFQVEGHLHQLELSQDDAGASLEIERIVLEYEENDTFV